MEKALKPMSGYLALILAVLSVIGAIFCLVMGAGKGDESNTTLIFLAVFLILFSVFLIKGIMVVNPNHSRVCTFFGKYVGTVKEKGLLWVNPFFVSYKITLRSQNLNGQQLKVNDKMGNPIEIAAVIVWQVSDTYKAAFDVMDFQQYVGIQSEAAVRQPGKFLSIRSDGRPAC